MGVDINNPKAVVSKVIKDAIIFSIVALVIAFIMNGLGWELFGFILACIIAIPMAFNIVKFVILDLPMTIFATGVYIWEKSTNRSIQGAFKNHVLLPIVGNVFMFLENACYLIIIPYLYHAY